jgi:phenylacetate-coenzyme A ligase PaaK-like adenylate-forming protein
MHVNQFKKDIFHINSDNFEKKTLEIFHYQAQNNTIYKKYISALGIDNNKVDKIEKIPFLPIEFFKTHKVISGNFEAQKVFESSGTTGQIRSKHYVKDLKFYHQVSKTIFESLYGKLENYCLLALLPSYLERDSSSLVEMAKYFMEYTQKGSGFFLNDTAKLKEQIHTLKQKNIPVLLLGVTFALLDLADNQAPQLPTDSLIMETGGMKGRRKEMIRPEVHQILQDAFTCPQIHSEYGMTELLSQFYAKKEGVFRNSTWAKVILRDVNDPFDMNATIKSGGINIIDLANIDSCCFLETKDLARRLSDDTFEVLGRFDNSDIRGCSLLMP